MADIKRAALCALGDHAGAAPPEVGSGRPAALQEVEQPEVVERDKSKGISSASFLACNLDVIDANGYPLTYVERCTGVPLILVQRSTGDYRAWNTVLEPLAARCPLLLICVITIPNRWKGDGGSFSAEQQHAAELVKTL